MHSHLLHSTQYAPTKSQKLGKTSAARSVNNGSAGLQMPAEHYQSLMYGVDAMAGFGDLMMMS
jgi:hypothetical protein